MKRPPIYQYFCVTDERVEYLGRRYFRYEPASGFCVQVCITLGEIAVKKGRGHMLGIYLIGRLTFLSNYLAMNYVVPCTESVYKDAFREVVKNLS